MQPASTQIISRDIIRQKAILEEVNTCLESLQNTKHRLKEDIQSLYIKREELRHDVVILNREISCSTSNIETVKADNDVVFNFNAFFGQMYQKIINSFEMFKIDDNRNNVEAEINSMREKAQQEIADIKTQTEENIIRTKRNAERELSLLQRQKDYISKEINDLLQKYIEAKRTMTKEISPTQSKVNVGATSYSRAGVLQR